MSYTVFVAYTDDECKAFGIGGDCYTIDNISDLHEAIGLAEKEMKQEPRLEDGFEVRHAFIVNEQNNFTVWRSNDPPELKAYTYSYDEWNTIQHGHHEKSDTPSVYFDIDGVLGKWYADGRGFSYEEIINPQNHYFRDIEPHDMMIYLAETLQDNGMDVCIISSADENTIRDKWEWIEAHLPFIPKENICFSPLGADKSEFVKGNAEISILIDDYNKNLEEWKGTSIKALNTVNSHQDKFAEIDFRAEEMLPMVNASSRFMLTRYAPPIQLQIIEAINNAAQDVTDAVNGIIEKQEIKNRLYAVEEVLGDNLNSIYINTKNDTMTWVYCNSDSNAGGQLVYYEFSFNDLQEALKTSDPIDYIQCTCRQNCVDVDNPCFVSYARDFLEPYGDECVYGEIYRSFLSAERVSVNLEAALFGVEEDRKSERLNIENQLLEDGIDKEDAKLAAAIFTEKKHRNKGTKQQGIEI